ncbi:MAG: hypothetical protein DRI95_11330 [Bacteroidetes bacterium]|nr:MAG: hypothetical protein DRI95_11330 [Bacteroidota bacterium]
MGIYKYCVQVVKITLVVLLFNNVLLAQDDDIIPFGEVDDDYQEYFLGFNLTSNINGGLVNYALVKPLPNGKNKVILLSKNNFIQQALGKQKSMGNPKKINLFEKFQIKSPLILDHLWKLRYKVYPNLTREKMDPGWSENDSIPFIPTEAQMEILRGFGIERFTDYIYNEEAFRLLSSMEDPGWVKIYKESF